MPHISVYNMVSFHDTTSIKLSLHEILAVFIEASHLKDVEDIMDIKLIQSIG